MRPERRKSPRRQLRYPARLDLGADNPRWDCTLQDISEGGAKLKLRGPDNLPEEFNLLLAIGPKTSRRCKLVWRTEDTIGVRFLGAAVFDGSVRRKGTAVDLDC